MDDWLATNEKGVQDGGVRGGDSIAGVGVFYFEGPSADRVSDGTLVAGQRLPLCTSNDLE